MKSILGFLLLAAALAVGGCGSSDTSTAAEQEAFKHPDKSALKGPPPDAFKPDPGFKSSLGGGSGSTGPKAPASGTGPGGK